MKVLTGFIEIRFILVAEHISDKHDSCQILLLQQVTNIITLLLKWQKGVIFLTLVVYFTWGYSIRVRFSLISEFIEAWHTLLVVCQ